MEILSFLAKYNFVGMIVACIGVIGIYRYKIYDENTGAQHKTQKLIFGALFVIGIIYLVMPLWIKLFGF